MQQRRLRLGDILDDYCPRERRITNHAVVAMMEDQVKHTRCTTCDADHEYKEARVPVRRRKDAGALIAGAGAAGPLRRAAAPAAPVTVADVAGVVDVVEALELDAPVLDEPLAQAHDAHHEDDESHDETQDALVDSDEIAPRIEEDGPVHRRLIRATLPRPEGATPEWKDPEFTIRQPTGRNGHGNGSNADGNRNGRHRRAMRGQGGGMGAGQQPRFGNQQRHGQGNSRPGGQGNGNGNSNRGGGRPGQSQPGQHRGPRPGGQGRNRGR